MASYGKKSSAIRRYMMYFSDFLSLAYIIIMTFVSIEHQPNQNLNHGTLIIMLLSTSMDRHNNLLSVTYIDKKVSE